MISLTTFVSERQRIYCNRFAGETTMNIISAFGDTRRLTDVR